jgi:hypothetical protein
MGREYDQDRWRHEQRGRDYDLDRWYDDNQGYNDFGGREHSQNRWRSGREYDQERYRAGGQGYTGRDYGSEGYGGSYASPAAGTYREAWLIPGPFSGRGPRGYQRSDERIREDVCDRLTQHGQIDAGEVDIQVSDCEVTLTGSVNSREAKRMAEDTAESVAGVREVHNQLRVKHDQGMQTQPSAQNQQGAQRRAVGGSEQRS